MFDKKLINIIFAFCAMALLAVNCVDDNTDDDDPPPTKTEYTVTYNINGGMGSVPAVQKVNEGSSVTLAGGSGFWRDEFTFEGWNTNAGGNGANYAAGSSFMPAGNITLYARWISWGADIYAVTVSSVGTGAYGSGGYEQGETVSINAGTAPAGQKFKNWTTASGGVSFANANNAATTFSMPANAVTVTANFEQSGTGVCTQWSSWSVKTNATCDAAGEETRTCQAGIDSTDVRVIAQLSGPQCNITYGTLSYGGQTYKTVKIGTQTWMAENLNYAGESGNVGVCYDNNSSYCGVYGRLYSWSEAMGFASSCNSNFCASQVQSPHRGICPSGWHIPSDAEWTALTNFVGGGAGEKLRSATGWNTGVGYIPGTNEFGFSALPAGTAWDGEFTHIDDYGYWWSATEDAALRTWNRNVDYLNSEMYKTNINKAYPFSVRCLQN